MEKIINKFKNQITFHFWIFTLVILFCVVSLFFIPFQKIQSVFAQQTDAFIYTVYGGTNANETLPSDWTEGSDNVVWDFGQKDMVYRGTKALSLTYNPGGEFHVTTATPLDISKYNWLTFTGRAKQENLDFSITFTDSNNRPIGVTQKFSDHGGIPFVNNWTQYNFPISQFYTGSTPIGGIRISQLSGTWGAVIYLDEIYISNIKGENINPAISTPSIIQPSGTIDLSNDYFPLINPWIFIVPFFIICIAVLFH